MKVHGRDVPENQVKKAGLFVAHDRVGEIVQKLVDDPDVVSFKITSGLTVNDDWFVVWKYAVLDLELHLNQIEDRHYALTGESPTHRFIDG